MLVAYTKKCAGPCGYRKPLSAFNKHPASKDGLQSYCRDCSNDAVRRYREKKR